MSTNRMIALGLVGLLHVGLGYAFVTGLALKAVKAIVNPIEAVNVKEEAPPPDEPPPPPPKDVEIPPFVPPPEVSIVSEAAPTITVQQTQPQPEPPRFTPPVVAAPAPPRPSVATLATAKGRGNTLTDDDYPPASMRAEESGTTKVRYTISTDGRATNCVVTQSSGFPRLDDAACKIIERRYRFNPAKDAAGQPIEEQRPQSVKWTIPK